MIDNKTNSYLLYNVIYYANKVEELTSERSNNVIYLVKKKMVKEH